MGGASKSLSLIRRSAAPALALIVVGTFAGHAVAGPNGILAWGGYHRALEQRKAELAQLEKEKGELKHRSDLLDPRHADPDLADEMTRKQLGLVRPDEVIIPLELTSAASARPSVETPFLGMPSRLLDADRLNRREDRMRRFAPLLLAFVALRRRQARPRLRRSSTRSLPRPSPIRRGRRTSGPSTHFASRPKRSPSRACARAWSSANSIRAAAISPA